MDHLLSCDSASQISTGGTSHEDWGVLVPLSDLPPMPARGEGYYTEPWCGSCTVGILCVMFVGAVQSLAATGTLPSKEFADIVVLLIWLWAIIAIFCTAYIIFAEGGIIRRSEQTCYPIPDEVAKRLMSNESLRGMSNISGPPGSKMHGTYCVRCLVWRPKRSGRTSSHHCNTCQRCFTGFDHHCGVFGRCIVNNNLLCFYLLIAMLFTGIVTVMVAVNGQASSPTYHPSRYLEQIFRRNSTL